jgi:hypothetical protein
MAITRYRKGVALQPSTLRDVYDLHPIFASLGTCWILAPHEETKYCLFGELLLIPCLFVPCFPVLKALQIACF